MHFFLSHTYQFVAGGSGTLVHRAWTLRSVGLLAASMQVQFLLTGLYSPYVAFTYMSTLNTTIQLRDDDIVI
jgi:hypothetical protein